MSVIAIYRQTFPNEDEGHQLAAEVRPRGNTALRSVLFELEPDLQRVEPGVIKAETVNTLAALCGKAKMPFAYSEALKEFRKQFILAVLRASHWNKSKAARELGMHRSTLVRALRELNIDFRALRNAERRPPHGVGTLHEKKSTG